MVPIPRPVPVGRAALVLGGGILLAAIAGCGRAAPSPEAIPAPLDPGIPPLSFSQTALVTVLPQDAIPAIDDPQFVAADRVGDDMADGEKVLGIAWGGEARAYPVAILSRHEVVNDQMAGQPVAITWCPLCYTGLIYSRSIEDEVLSFGVSGKLLMNGLVMYDRQTGSLWSQVLGRAISGPWEGQALGLLPVTHTDWGIWRGLYPDTLVLSKSRTAAQFPRLEYRIDPYISYYAAEDRGVVGTNLEPGVGVENLKEFVIGVRVGGEAIAYPFRELSQQPVLNEVVGGTPVLVAFEAGSATGAVFDRRVAGRTLAFALSRTPEAEGESILLRDEETGSTWDGLTGRAQAGELVGQRLTPIPSSYFFLFAWRDHFPGAAVFGR